VGSPPGVASTSTSRPRGRLAESTRSTQTGRSASRTASSATTARSRTPGSPSSPTATTSPAASRATPRSPATARLFASARVGRTTTPPEWTASSTSCAATGAGGLRAPSHVTRSDRDRERSSSSPSQASADSARSRSSVHVRRGVVASTPRGPSGPHGRPRYSRHGTTATDEKGGHRAERQAQHELPPSHRRRRDVPDRRAAACRGPCGPPITRRAR
jgi:hypothetical protein